MNLLFTENSQLEHIVMGRDVDEYLCWCCWIDEAIMDDINLVITLSDE